MISKKNKLNKNTSYTETVRQTHRQTDRQTGKKTKNEKKVKLAFSH